MDKCPQCGLKFEEGPRWSFVATNGKWFVFDTILCFFEYLREKFGDEMQELAFKRFNS